MMSQRPQEALLHIITCQKLSASFWSFGSMVLLWITDYHFPEISHTWLLPCTRSCLSSTTRQRCLQSYNDTHWNCVISQLRYIEILCTSVRETRLVRTCFLRSGAINLYRTMDIRIHPALSISSHNIDTHIWPGSAGSFTCPNANQTASTITDDVVCIWQYTALLHHHTVLFPSLLFMYI